MDLRRIEAWEILRTGDEIMDQGDTRAALDRYRSALNQLQALSAADANDVQVQVQVAIAMGRIGSALLQAGDARAALVELQKARWLSASAFADPASRNGDLVWAMALNQFEMAKAHALLAADRTLPAEVRRDHPGRRCRCISEALRVSRRHSATIRNWQRSRCRKPAGN